MVNTYPYWKSSYRLYYAYTLPNNYKLLSLPSFTFSNRDSIQELEERTNVFNNSLKKYKIFGFVDKLFQNVFEHLLLFVI